MIFEVAFFCFVLFIVFYLPGRFIVRKFGYTFQSQTIHLPVSFAVGLSSFIFCTFLLSYIHLDFLYNLFILVPIIYELKQMYGIQRKRKGKYSIPFLKILLLTAGSLWMTFLMWNSGRIIDDSIVFYAVNSVDAIWHLSLIGNLTHSFPPTHPGLDPVTLKGYNFLYDFLLSRFVTFYSFDKFDLFFRLFPPFIAIFYGLSGFAVAQMLKMKKITAFILVYLLYFGFGFEELLSHIFRIDLDPGIVHSSANMVDPSVILSVILLFCIFILFFSAKNAKQTLLPAIMLGILPMIKIYTAVLAFISFACIVLKDLLSRKYQSIPFLICAGIVAATFYVPTNFGAGSLVFAPFLIFKHYMEGEKVFPDMLWSLKLATYQVDHNLIRIVQLYLIAVLSFIIPSLGINMLSLVELRNIFKVRTLSDQNIFLIIFILAGFVIPTLFIQSIAVFVIMQFMWIACIILFIPTANSVAYILQTSGKIKIIILLSIFILFSLVEMAPIYRLYSSEPEKFQSNQLELLMQLGKVVPSSNSVLVIKSAEQSEYNKILYTTPLVSALTSRNVYYEPEVLEFAKLDDLRNSRITKAVYFELMLQNCSRDKIIDEIKQFKTSTDVSYLLVFKNYSCLSSIPNLKKIYGKDSLSLYQFQ